MTHEYRWYYLSGVKFDNLPGVSFTSPGFLNISRMPHLV